MDFVIALLQEQKKEIDRNIKRFNLLQKNMTKASREMSKVSELKRAIKVLKTKKNSYDFY